MLKFKIIGRIVINWIDENFVWVSTILIIAAFSSGVYFSDNVKDAINSNEVYIDSALVDSALVDSVLVDTIK